MLGPPDVVRLIEVFAASGVFWMMILFLLERVSMKRPLPGSIPLAILVLVASAYVLIGVVLQGSALAFLIPTSY